jgi:hypothetical protein
MEQNRLQPHDPEPRRFTYRSAQPDTQFSHPLRRRTDTLTPFHAGAGHICPEPLEFRMYVYVRLN